MAFAKGSSGGRHALGRQQTSGKAERDGASRGKGLFSKSTGKHTGKGRGNSGGGSGKGGAADDCGRWA